MRALTSFLKRPMRLRVPETKEGKRKREEAETNIVLSTAAAAAAGEGGRSGVNNYSLLRLDMWKE